MREAITEAWKPLVDELTVSRMGSLHALKKGAAEPVDGAPRPRILLAAHMDAIGLMVTGIAPGGFLRIFRIGGVDPRILPGMPVMVYAKRELPGIIVQPVDSLLPHSLQNKPVRMEYLLVDTGLEEEEVRALVRVGDLISFATPPTELTGDTLSGHSLDNRASVAALTLCLEELQRARHAWDVYCVATVQEEETLLGGFTSPFEIRPQIAVAVDVTHAKGPWPPTGALCRLAKASPWIGGLTPTRPCSKLSRTWPTGSNCRIPSRSIRPVQAPMPWACRLWPKASPPWWSASRCAICIRRSSLSPIKISAATGQLLAQFIAGLDLDFVEKLKYEE